MLLIVSAVGCTEEVEVPLSLQITAPHNTGDVAIMEPVHISFNRPLKSFALQCYPPAIFGMELGEDATSLAITPHGAWSYDTTYEISIEGVSAQFITQRRPSISIFAGGDVLLDKRPGENILRFGPEYVFTGVKSLLSSTDIRFVNLENPTSIMGAPVQKNFRFRSPPETLDALVYAGINVVSFANNHSFDYGQSAFVDTLEHLDVRSIRYVGAGRDRDEALRPVVFNQGGLKVAFIGFMQRTILPAWSPALWESGQGKSGVVFLDGEQGLQDILQAVSQAREKADVVLVSLHWGVEGTRAPEGWQRNLGRTIIEAGADAILGHHPHLPFGIESYLGKPIIYSMGNMLFHPYDPEARESFVVKLDYGPEGLDQMEVHPIVMIDGAVSLLKGEEANNVLELVATRSLALGTRLTRKSDKLLFIDVVVDETP